MLNLRNLEKNIFGILGIFLLLSFGFADEAHAGSLLTYQVLDNDDGAINSSKNAYSKTWTHGNSSGSYRGDYRISYTSGGEYQWNFQSQSSRTRQYYVYLNHPNFTNPFAEYHVWSSYNLGAIQWSEHVGSVNQNLAYPGWNKVGGEKAYTYNAFRLTIINTSAGTGADGAEVDFYN
jgi:hypothetical protein